MPVVELSYSRLQKLVGKVSKKTNFGIIALSRIGYRIRRKRSSKSRI